MSLDFDALTAFTQDLVRRQTLPGQEQPVAELAAAEMQRLGYDQVWTDMNGSVIGLINGARSGPTLLFDAHTDTVGVAPGVPWQHDPFGAKIEAGRMYGRGVSDMKGALAAMIHAAAAVDKAHLAGRIVICASVMEEVLEGVALKAVMAEIKPDYVVIGESTDLNLNSGGRGRAEIQVETIGQPAHSSAPHLGINAVHLMLDVVQAIAGLPQPSDPLLGPAVMVLTDIISDPYPGHSVIPSRCRVTYDRRLLAGETTDSVLSPLRQLPGLAGANMKITEGEYTTYTGITLHKTKFFPAWKLPAEHPLVQAGLEGLRSAGLKPQLGAYRFCTNAAYSAGEAGVPTVGFGPSPESRAHTVDEYIELPDLHAAARGYLGLINSVLS